MSTKPPPREQEQTIKTRKQLLFDADEPLVGDDESTGPRKSFAEYVRETPAAPLNGLTKAALWGAAALVVLLLIFTVMKTSGGNAQKTAPKNSAIHRPAYVLA